MDLAWWRDLMIVLAGASMTLATLLFTILTLIIAIVMFKRVKKLMALADAAIGHVDEVAKLVKAELVRPVTGFAAVVHAVSEFAGSVSRLFVPRSPDKRKPSISI